MSESKLIAFNIIKYDKWNKKLSKQHVKIILFFQWTLLCDVRTTYVMLPCHSTLLSVGVWVILILWRQRTQTLLFVHSKKINILRRNVVSWGLVGNGNPLIIWRLTLMRSLSVHYKVEVVVKSTPLEKHSTTNNSSYSNSCNTIF